MSIEIQIHILSLNTYHLKIPKMLMGYRIPVMPRGQLKSRIVPAQCIMKFILTVLVSFFNFIQIGHFPLVNIV